MLLKTSMSDDGRGFVAKGAGPGGGRGSAGCRAGGGAGGGRACRRSLQTARACGMLASRLAYACDQLWATSAPSSYCPSNHTTKQQQPARRPKQHHTAPRCPPRAVADFGLSLQLPDGASHVSGVFQGTMTHMWAGGLPAVLFFSCRGCSEQHRPRPGTLTAGKGDAPGCRSCCCCRRRFSRCRRRRQPEAPARPAPPARAKTPRLSAPRPARSQGARGNDRRPHLKGRRRLRGEPPAGSCRKLPEAARATKTARPSLAGRDAFSAAPPTSACCLGSA